MNENKKYCKDIAEELQRIYNGEIKNDDGEIMTLWEYMNDILDYEYTINSRKEYTSVKIWVALGGPNVWIDTGGSYVRLAWGADREEYPLNYDVCAEIDSIFEEYYNY